MDELRAQGATEYLVLLAVVLIVALVSVALLGFFPGMASDAQITQSQAYWQSASPIAIVEAGAAGTTNEPTGRGLMYFRLKNNGNYPITITKIIGTTSTNYISIFYCNSGVEAAFCGSPSGVRNISDYYYLSPGEEKPIGFGTSAAGSANLYREIDFYKASGTSGEYVLRNAASDCLPTSPYGTLSVKNFGFEYIERIEGQSVTKRQIGTAPLIVKCRPPAW